MKLGLPWFGPKTGFGWGWTPVTWQGWGLTLVFVFAVTLAVWANQGRHGVLIGLGMTAVFTGVVWLTGTKPGGRLFG